MKQKKIHAIYIGTTKLAALRGVMKDNGEVLVERFVKIPAEGFEKGVVVNIEKASAQIRELIHSLDETIENSKIDFYIILSNGFLRNYSCSSSIYFGEIMKPINRGDIEKVVSQTKAIATIPLDEYIIEETPRSYIVNDFDDIIDPLELEARRLGVNLLLFTVDGPVIRNIMKSLERVDVITDIYIPRAVCSSCAVLRQEERNDGIVMVDIGGHVSDIIYIKNTVIHYYETIQVGGENISRYLAEQLNVTQTEARRLKERFGSAVLLSSFEDEIIPVVDLFGKTRLSLNKKRLYDQIFISAKELLTEINTVINHIRKEVGIVPGIVLTGGGAALDGLLELSYEVFQAPVRLGVTRKISGPKEVISSPQYTAIAGIMGYVLDKHKRDEQRFRNKNYLTKKMIQAKEWIQDYF